MKHFSFLPLYRLLCIKFGRFIYPREGHGILRRVQDILILFFERVLSFHCLTPSPTPPPSLLISDKSQVGLLKCITALFTGIFRWLGSQYFTTALTMSTIGSHFEDGPEKGSHILVIVEGRRIFEIREHDQ